MTERAVSFVVGFACEDAVDHRVVSTLFDEIASRQADWVRDGLDGLRRYVDWDGREGWAHLPDARATLAKHGNIRRLHGRSEGPDYQMLRAARMLFDRLTPRPVAVLLVRDRDGHAHRLTSARAAQTLDGAPCVVASPEPEIEAWILAGFEAGGDADNVALLEERTRLGFDPTREPHRLTSTSAAGKRDVKEVLQRLVGNDRERAHACIARLSDLSAEDCGLAEFTASATRLARKIFLTE